MVNSDQNIWVTTTKIIFCQGIVVPTITNIVVLLLMLEVGLLLLELLMSVKLTMALKPSVPDSIARNIFLSKIGNINGLIVVVVTNLVNGDQLTLMNVLRIDIISHIRKRLRNIIILSTE